MTYARTVTPSPPAALRRHPHPRRRYAWCGIVSVALVIALGPPVRAGGAAAGGHGSHSMSATAMQAEAAAYWAAHPRTGAAPGAALGAPAATFTVANFEFDDGTAGQVDTVFITVGESVMWQWVSGTHTITSGTGSSDPNQGVLFNQPSDLNNQQFSFTFNSAGTFPFFCAFHELANMRGVVEVSESVGIGPSTPGAALGFVRDPAPNPTRLGSSFRFALRRAGRVRAEVFDAGGRRVATLVDADLPAGTFSGVWNGRTTSGPAATGVYYVRLQLPGYDAARPVVVQR